jgi:hypothetical protein
LGGTDVLASEDRNEQRVSVLLSRPDASGTPPFGCVEREKTDNQDAVKGRQGHQKVKPWDVHQLYLEQSSLASSAENLAGRILKTLESAG